MKLNNSIFILLFLLTIPFYSVAQNRSKEQPAIIKNIESGKKVKVNHSEEIDRVINIHSMKTAEVAVVKNDVSRGSYRVQVFSSNDQRTAKNAALVVERKVKTAFPLQGVYRSYSSPFWKVRVGSFATREDANRFKDELSRVLPELRAESYVVLERR